MYEVKGSEQDVKNNSIKSIEDYEKKQKRDRINKILIIIIIIIILLMLLACWRIGKIGYDTKPEPSKPVFDEKIPTIKVSDDITKWKENTELNIFSNIKFEGESIIAPNSNGTYKFVIENISDTKISYDISFKDVMSNPVNMKYKLKIDNVYIRGDENNYIDINSLNIEDIIILENSNNVFILEWYWEDDDNADTYVGSKEIDQYYTLNLNIQAEAYEE